MGEAKDSVGSVSFNGSIRIEGRPERLTSHAGAVLLRETDERIGFTAALAAKIEDPRNQDWITHPMSELVRARIYAMALGERDQDDIDDLRDDPVLRLAVSERRGDAPLREQAEESRIPDGLASQPTQSRLVETLSSAANLAVLGDALFGLAATSHQRLRRSERARRGTIDVDSTAIETHGSQPGSAYNGHYKTTCYHPLVAMLASTGDWLGVALRPGQVHTSVGLDEFLMPLIDRTEKEICQVASVRADAGMPGGPLLDKLDARKIGYVMRLATNDVLKDLAAPHLRRPVGRPPNEIRTWCVELSYQAGTWSRARRVVLVVIDEPGELFLRHFFLLTSWDALQMPAEELLGFYRERGTMEGHIGDLKNTLRPALSSTSRPKSHIRGEPIAKPGEPRDGYACNAANLLLFALAYNLANLLRRVTARATAEPWRLRRMRDTLLRVPARVVLHARRVTVVLREEAAPLWTSFLRRLERLLPHAPPLRA